ncbi:MAG: hypothetical protein GYA17_13790 [Chloroflexi bacterium]|nr:hypothetical protein [Chloroflexota bacterium]
MRAVHWVRSRQEERELTYWLSLVSYDRHDQSFNNRVYLLYLVIFFSVWVFMTLSMFASGGASLLELLVPGAPARAAAWIELALLGAWSAFCLAGAVRRSPILFSEQDAVLLSQTPVSRRQVVLRWLWMPWLESAIPFCLAAVTLGFSLAETSLPASLGASQVAAYTAFGLRAGLAILPVHLALFSLHWVVGVLRLQRDAVRPWLPWPVLAGGLACGAAVLAPGLPWLPWLEGLVFPLDGNLTVALLAGAALAVTALGLLAGVSPAFSLSRAAQETQEVELLQTAQRYRLNDYAAEIRSRQRMGVSRHPARLPALRGAGALVWKDLVQSRRAWRWADLFQTLSLFTLMLAVPLLPDLNGRLLSAAVWIFLLGKAAVVRLRSDLAAWPLARQLPIAYARFLGFDLLLAVLGGLVAGWAGLVVGAWLAGQPVHAWALLLPGVATAAAGAAAYDVIRRARSSLLLNGSVPEAGASGVLLGLLLAGLPLLLSAALPGATGLGLSCLAGLLLAALALGLAIRAYRNVDAPRWPSG